MEQGEEGSPRNHRRTPGCQINQNGQTQSVSLGDARNYSDRDKKDIIDNLYQPIDEAEAEEIMET